MSRRNPALLVSTFVLLLSCGRATVKDIRHVDLVVAGVSFDAGTVTVLARHKACSTQLETIKVATSDEQLRACLRGLAEGQSVELVERQMHFATMTCGAKPTVAHTLGACTIPRDAMSTQGGGEACKPGPT